MSSSIYLSNVDFVTQIKETEFGSQINTFVSITTLLEAILDKEIQLKVVNSTSIGSPKTNININ